MKTGLSVPATAQALWPQYRDGAASRSAWQALLGLVSRGPVLACADQAIVSATSFFTLVMIARWTDASQLGAFAIGISVLGVSIAIQHSVVSMPYSIQRHGPLEFAAEHAFCCLLQSAFFSALVAVLLAIAALTLSALGASPQSVKAAWALAAVTPFVLTKEFARDFALARLRPAGALALDAAAASIQLAVIIGLGLTGRLSPITAYCALGLSCGMAVLCWLLLSRADFAFRIGQFRDVSKQSWHLGKWLLLSRSAILLQGYSTYWLSMLVAGAATTGVYAACMSVVSFANPILLGLYNFLVPRSVLAWKDGGGAGLHNQAIRDTLLLGGLMGAFCLAVLLAGESALGLLYPDGTYKNYADTVALLAFAALASALGIPASNALASMERPRPMAFVAGLSALLNVVLVWFLMTRWGLSGAALGVLAANLVGTLGRWILFLALTRKARS